MAEIASFRGYRYNTAEVDDLNKVVTQPYDKIDEELRDEYYERHENNVVRIIMGKSRELDNPNDNKYTRGADYWNSWIEDRVLIREGGPAIYPYHQEYTVDGQTNIRKGLIVLIALDDKKSKVRAHEKTLSGPKADRLKLMRATEANDGQIFMLYDEPENKINKMLDDELMMASPIMEVKDDLGAIHRLYRITSPGFVKDMAELFEEHELFIADGHHRYETAVNYMNECKQRNWKEPIQAKAETFSFRMMTLVNMHDPGLKVLPTHRLVHSLDGFNPNSFLAKAAPDFEIDEYNDRSALYAALDEAGKSGGSVFGFAAEGLEGYRLMTLKDPTLMDRIVEGEHSETWRRLDVTVLHTALLDRLLGINAEKLASYSNVHYIRGQDNALNLVGKNGNQAAFLLNPTPIDRVRAIALAGERMPQKSTDFFPKLLTGMVMMKMQIDKSMGLAVYETDE